MSPRPGRSRAPEWKGLSFTGFVLACVARAGDEDEMLRSHRWGWPKLVLFEDVDVDLQLERTQVDGVRIVQYRLVRVGPDPPGAGGTTDDPRR